MTLINFKSLFVFVVVFALMTVFVYAETDLGYLRDGNDDYKIGNLDQAIYEYTKAIELNPNLFKAYDNRGVAYAQEGSLQRAIADFTMAIANNPKDAQAYNNRGHAYGVQGNFYQAIYDYSKAIEINPIYGKAYNNRGLAYYNLKKYDRSWADVHKLKEIGSPVDPQFLEDLIKASGKTE